MSSLRIALFGDIVGNTGRDIFARHIATLRTQYKLDGVIINGENSANGKGVTPAIVEFLKQQGVDVVTTGNHIWDKKDIIPYIQNHDDIIRPANYPSSCPGKGFTIFSCKGYKVAVLNLMGRVFMRQQLDCPFKTADSLLTFIRSKTNIILVDMHAETTSEKLGLAYYLDGRVSGIVGTHTHVQTADERILPGGTGYITDMGMGGSLNSMIGLIKEPLISGFLDQMPVRHEVDTEPPYVLSGVVMTIDTTTGKTTHIERIYKVDTEPLA